MKNFTFLLLGLMTSTFAFAQVTVRNNGTFFIGQNAQVVINGGDLSNNGNMSNNGTLTLNGSYNSTTSGVFDNSKTFTANEIVNSNDFNNDSVVTVNGDIINYSNFLNTPLGEITVTGDFSNDSSFTNNGAIRFASNFASNNAFSKFNSGVGSSLTFNGTGSPNFDLDGDTLYNLIINGSTASILQNSFFLVIKNQLTLTNGKIGTAFSPLKIDSTATIVGGSEQSHVKGQLIIKKTGVVTFPIGEPGATIAYRPVTLTNVPAATLGETPSILMSIVPSPGTLNYNTDLVSSVSENRVWRMQVSGDYKGSPITIGVGGRGLTTGDGPTFAGSHSLDTAVITYAPTISDNFIPIGDSLFTGTFGSVLAENSPTGTLTSRAKAQEGFFAIGVSDNAKLNVKVMLEGAAINATSMRTMDYDTLVYNYGPGGVAADTMLAGYEVPANAVDVITVVLRTGVTKTAPIQQTRLAWLMNDGSIRDFHTGQMNFLSFNDVGSASYNVVVRHRNHLSIVRNVSATVLRTYPSPVVDMTTMGQIYGGGAKLIAGTTYGMIGGNARNNDQVINSQDLFRVTLNNSSLVSGYLTTDTYIDGFPVTNSLDLNLTSTNNDVGYFSTAE